MGSYKAALADLSRAIDINPDYEFAITERSDIYNWLEQWDKALNDKMESNRSARRHSKSQKNPQQGIYLYFSWAAG